MKPGVWPPDASQSSLPSVQGPTGRNTEKRSQRPWNTDRDQAISRKRTDRERPARAPAGCLKNRRHFDEAVDARAVLAGYRLWMSGVGSRGRVKEAVLRPRTKGQDSHPNENANVGKRGERNKAIPRIQC